MAAPAMAKKVKPPKNIWVFTHQQDGDVNYTDLTAIDCEGLDPTS